MELPKKAKLTAKTTATAAPLAPQLKAERKALVFQTHLGCNSDAILLA
jgi:hypothetical protein